MDVIAFGPQRQIGCSPEGISIRINFEARFKNLRKFLATIYARVGELNLGVRVASNGSRQFDRRTPQPRQPAAALAQSTATPTA